MGLLRPGVLPGLFKYSKTVSVLAKLVDSGWLMLDPHTARGSSGAGKALMEGGKGWGNREIKYSLPGVSSGAAGVGAQEEHRAEMGPVGVLQLIAPTSRTSALFLHPQSLFFM